MFYPFVQQMGFTSTRYPVLNSKIDERVPLGGEVSKENEDKIVTEVVEELLLVSPSPAPKQPPKASGSGTRRT